MADRGLELERLQRETNEALGLLTVALREATGREPAAGATVRPAIEEGALDSLSGALDESSRAVRELTDGLGANTAAARASAAAFAEGVQGLLGGLGRDLASGGGIGRLLSSGFGLAPLASGLLRLFGRGRGDREEAVFEPLLTPPPLRRELALGGEGLTPVSRGAGEEIRATEARQAAAAVVVNVSAMDARSFLERSDEIARAVREAMLHMHPVNDVVGEL